jgi:DNA-binding NarL/FixJ family response regulator
VAKKRPRSTDAAGLQVSSRSTSKFDAEYWERRLFKNTFTYKGRRMEVRGWSVKIQLSGRRKTFTVNAADRGQAAIEAAQVYHTLVTHGWDAFSRSRGQSVLLASPAAKPLPGHNELTLDYWRSRLIHRKYPEASNLQPGPEFSVRIDYCGTRQYFPLGTADEDEAAAHAMRIYQTIVAHGWETAYQQHPRELTLALRWLDDPLAWTYTTIHTVTTFSLAGNSAAQRDLAVAIVEPDPGIRFALGRCAASQTGFSCSAVFASAAEVIREASRGQFDIILANQSLPDQSAAASAEDLGRALPDRIVCFYSVFEDSDELFRSTPGGAIGYMLKRTPATRIFESILGVPRPLRRDEIIHSVRGYFQQLSASIPAQTPIRELAKLTPREHEILEHLSKGNLAKEIADQLGISIWTVHGHVKSIFEKLNVHSRIEAVVKFLQK